MSNLPDTTNVTSSKPASTGAVLVADVGSPIPTIETTEDGGYYINIPDVYQTVGYLSTDGYERDRSIETSSIEAWGGDTVLNMETSQKNEYKFSMLEHLNKLVHQIVEGNNNVSGSLETGLVIDSKPGEREARAYIIHEILKDGVESVTVIPNGEVVAIESEKHTQGDAVSHGITVGAVPSILIDNGTSRTILLKK